MISTAGLLVCMVVISVIASFTTCAVFKWVYSWKGDVVVGVRWKSKPRCPQCGLDLNTRPLLEIAEIEVTK